MEDKKFYITTAIPYMNAKLHIGQVYEFILADVVARFNRLMGKDVYMLTGSDEHGQKIHKSAHDKGISPQEYVDEMVDDMKRILKLYNIKNDGFIRTTDKKHEDIVKKIFAQLKENGDLYKDTYHGWYCVPCETFLLDSQLVDEKCPQCERGVEKVEEENYFFKLSKYEEKLIKHIEENPDFIIPETRKNEVLGLLKQGLKDISFSRTAVKWGVQMPFDEKHYSYVWVDALINYISALGFLTDEDSLYKKYWPADHHHIGKDILKFHAVIWPAILMSIGEELPKHVVVHGWVLMGKEKLSKSKGITLDPDDMKEKFGVDAIRYFLTREISFGQDGSFTEEAMTKRYNSDLSNDIGNLVSRSVAMIGKYREGNIPKDPGVGGFNDEWEEVKEKAVADLSSLDYAGFLAKVWEFINMTNKYIEDSAPWTLAKSDDAKDKKRLDIILYNLAEAIRLSAVIISPFMPETSQKILKQLGINDDISEMTIEDEAVWGHFKGGTDTGEREILFPRLEDR